MKIRALRMSSIVIAVAALAVACGLMIDSIGGPLERAITPLRYAAYKHDASGRVVVVEMDAQSTQVIGQWPWPRRYHAAVVDQLRRAGAASIVFDIDFSSASNATDDAAFAASLERSGGLVVLPTFGQRASALERRTIDALPISVLRQHVSLASVSVAPDADGLVRAMPFATVTSNTPRPSLSAFIAARAGNADTTFPINFAINPESVPRISFATVRDGRFDPAIVRDRNVLIGATAVEMGDRYATPLRGVLPGVVIQALAAETLIAGVPVSGWPPMTIIVSLLFSSAIVACRRTHTMSGVAACALVILVTGVLILQHQYGIYYPLAAAVAMLLVVTGLCIGREVFNRFREQRLIDEATGLPNRRAFLNSAIPSNGSLALFQINNLDSISAVIGGEVVDQVVARLAERLRLSSVDGQVYRARANHLAIYLQPYQTPEESIAELRTMMLQPVEVAGRKVDVTGTVGLADSGSASDHLTDAALAADQAVEDGAFWRRRTASIDRLERSISLMGELDAAIAAGEIKVVYQPKLALAENRVTSVEALVRWPHATRGFISPDEFIVLAEQTDRIEALTLYVLERVLSDVQEWRDRGFDISAAVNISAKLVASKTFEVAVGRALATSTTPSRALIFEVTESATLSDPTAAIAALKHFRKLGISVSLDDYGTGLSTLTYLRKLPLNELKIDKSFVRDLHFKAEDRMLVQSTIELAHKLGLRVVAEGVEDAECLKCLRELQCDLVQGYLISRPVPAPEILDFAIIEETRALSG